MIDVKQSQSERKGERGEKTNKERKMREEGRSRNGKKKILYKKHNKLDSAPPGVTSIEV